MRARLILFGTLAAVLALPAAAAAHPAETNSFAFGTGSAAAMLTHGPVDDGGADFTHTRNMRLLSFLEREQLFPPNTFQGFISDLAFWGDKAYQGTFQGFRIIDIDDPRRPRELIDYRDCANANGAGQGDIVVWGSILVRSWDSNTTQPSSCDGVPMQVGTPGAVPTLGNGFEGVHVFDVSDPGNPALMATVDLPCGSHTLSAVPDLRNRRLLVYSTPSQNDTQPLCHGIDVVDVPLSRPAESEYLRSEFAGRNQAEAFQFRCHDTAVILGRAMKAACAGGVGYAVWSLGGRDGGSLDNPRFLYNHRLPEIAPGAPNVDNATGHSASFSWDGETIIFGHEPGGGVNPRCQPIGTPLAGTFPPGATGTQTADMKSFFFFDTDSGQQLGKWTLTRDQTANENCTLHNYNIVPTSRDDILVHGSYQSGIGVLDFSNPANAREIAFADPAPLPPTPTAPWDGGDWGSYFYNGLIYESDIARGLYVWDFKDHDADRSVRLRHLNPQTQEFTIGARKDHDRWNEGDKWHDDDHDDDRD